MINAPWITAPARVEDRRSRYTAIRNFAVQHKGPKTSKKMNVIGAGNKAKRRSNGVPAIYESANPKFMSSGEAFDFIHRINES